MNIELPQESVVALLIAARIQMNTVNAEIFRCETLKDSKTLILLTKQRTDLHHAITALWKGRNTHDDFEHDPPLSETGS